MDNIEKVLNKYALGWTDIYTDIGKIDYTIRIKDRRECEKELLELGYIPEIESVNDTFITYLYKK